MTGQLTPNEARQKMQAAFESRVTAAVKSLLESKHLYQSLKLECADLVEEFAQRIAPQVAYAAKSSFAQLVSANWVPTDSAGGRPVAVRDTSQPAIRFTTPGVKLFCQTCDRVEAFNTVSSEDFLRREPTQRYVLSGQTVQLFVFSFLCQSCKVVPEVFLVRRQGLKLTNSGRSPIERVDVPPIIPKSVRLFCSGAVVAHQSGQTLAGVFLLRTVVEQWARSQVAAPSAHADEALGAYMGTLPDDFKSRFPSLRVLYADLSADIHSATGSAELFASALSQIVEHFEARRLFKL